MLNLRDSSIPLSLRWILAHGITSLTPWHFLADSDRIAALRAEYRTETNDGRDCWPFAVRQDCDDVAAFVIVDGTLTDSVIDVHLTYSRCSEREGFPSELHYPCFFDWFKAAVDATSDAACDIDLDDVLADGPAYTLGGFNHGPHDGG